MPSLAVVSGTVLDPNGLPYAYGKITADFVAGAVAGVPYTYGGRLLQITTVTGGLDGNGAFSIQLPTNTDISPSDSTWTFTVTSADGTRNFTYTVAITGDTDVSAGLVAAADSLGYGPQSLDAVGTISGEDFVTHIGLSTASSFLTGGSMIYSGGRGSSAVKVTGTYTGTAGGFSGIYGRMDTTGAIDTAGAGVIGLKMVVQNTGAMTNGVIYGGQFIAKHNHATHAMANAAALIGIEAWAYVADVGTAGTQIGANFGWHNEATGGDFPSGSVVRGIQIFCDNNAGGNNPDESTALCAWNQAGTIDNVIAVVNSGSGFTYLVNVFSAAGFAAEKGSDYSASNPRCKFAVKIGANTYYLIGYTTVS